VVVSGARDDLQGLVEVSPEVFGILDEKTRSI